MQEAFSFFFDHIPIDPFWSKSPRERVFSFLYYQSKAYTEFSSEFNDFELKAMQFFWLKMKEARDLLPSILFFYQIEMIDNVFIGI